MRSAVAQALNAAHYANALREQLEIDFDGDERVRPPLRSTVINE